MPRIPQRDPQTLDGKAGDWLRSAPIKLNLFGVMAQAEGCLIPLMGFGGSLLGALSLPEREREMLVLLVARLQDCDYEWTHHSSIALSIGVTAVQVAALKQLDLAGPFSDRDRAILEFGRQVILHADADDAALEEARRFLGYRELVEAMLTVGYYMIMCRVLNVARTEIDDDREAALKLFELSRRPKP
jgi:AhpD family alkylhydroperoxidase